MTDLAEQTDEQIIEWSNVHGDAASKELAFRLKLANEQIARMRTGKSN